MHRASLKMAGTKKEEAEGLAEALVIEVEEVQGSEGEEGGVGTLRALGVLEFLTQEAEPSGTFDG